MPVSQQFDSITSFATSVFLLTGVAAAVGVVTKEVGYHSIP